MLHISNTKLLTTYKTIPIIIGTITMLMNMAQLIALFAIDTFTPDNPIPIFLVSNFKLIVKALT